MQENTQRLYWVDVLRLVAMLMVIAAHCVDIYNATPQDDPMNSFWGVFIGSLMRPSVPLFAMMTGLLLLPIRESAAEFYKRRIPRVLIPMVLWSAVYYLIPWLTGVAGLDKSVITTLFPFEFSPSQEAGDAMRNIARIPFTFNGYTTHMWYLYMLIGLYLLMPFFSAWVEKRDSTMTNTYLLLWLCSLTLPYLKQLIAPNLFGECAWNEFGTFYYFAGFAGYLLLGHILARRHHMPLRRIIAMGVMLYISGYIITYTGYASMAVQYSYEEAPELLELFWQFCSPNVVLMALGIFLVVQRINITSPRLQSLLAATTRCSFGTYLMHYIFIGPVILLLTPLGMPTPLCVMASVIIVFGICWSLTALIYKALPRAARYIVG
ncbi:MAG: acyltransferase [Rikenellaceae bacterium]|nr:acyltransferase [Rikenellaceae bacterium]